MKLYWVTDEFKVGECFGMSLHNRKLRKGLEMLGVEFATSADEDYDLAVNVVELFQYRPVPDRKNVAFLQVEFRDQYAGWPEVWDRVREANVIVTSSEFGRREHLAHGFKGPVEICPLGIDQSLFSYSERHRPAPNEPFVFLFNNNEAILKGLPFLLDAWELWGVEGRPANAILSVKISGRSDGEESLDRSKMVYYNSQLLSNDDMAGLYKSAHAFINVSVGDGFGFGPFEAMSTGLPTIWTHHSSFLDYLDDSMGFPITELREELFLGREDKAIGYGKITEPSTIIHEMDRVYHHYEESLQRGRVASRKVKAHSWEASARRFLDILEAAI